jgi:hypothetical protein
MASNRAPIMVDGVVVGYLSLSWTEEPIQGMGLPPSAGLAGADMGRNVGSVPASPRAAREFGSTRQPHTQTHQAPHVRRLGHPHADEAKLPHGHRRLLDPAIREKQHAAEERGLEHLNTKDVAKALEGGGPKEGIINRSHHRQYLKEHPEVREKLLNVMVGEHGTSELGMQMIAEETMNRADVRGHSLERTSRYSSEPGGYSAGHRHGSAAERPGAERALEKALSGSNENNWATDNSSSWLAAKEARGGEFIHTREFEGEHFWTRNNERAAHEAWKNRQMATGGKPVGVTELPAPTHGGEPTFANTYVGPGAMNAPSGSPAAFIVHHTAGHGTPESVVEYWRSGAGGRGHGIGTQYIMDREGLIHDVAKEYGYAGRSHFKNSLIPGINNNTAVGMEIVAKDDADITAKQRENAIKFIQSQYPNTTPYGHSEVSHDRTNEGVDIARTIREMRANQLATKQASTIQHSNVVHIKPGDPLPPAGQPYTVDIDK